MCIVRASKGSKKISTVIRKEDLARFHRDYSNLLKVRRRRLLNVDVVIRSIAACAPFDVDSIGPHHCFGSDSSGGEKLWVSSVVGSQEQSSQEVEKMNNVCIVNLCVSFIGTAKLRRKSFELVVHVAFIMPQVSPQTEAGHLERHVRLHRVIEGSPICRRGVRIACAEQHILSQSQPPTRVKRELFKNSLPVMSAGDMPILGSPFLAKLVQ